MVNHKTSYNVILYDGALDYATIGTWHLGTWHCVTWHLVTAWYYAVSQNYSFVVSLEFLIRHSKWHRFEAWHNDKVMSLLKTMIHCACDLKHWGLTAPCSHIYIYIYTFSLWRVDVRRCLFFSPYCSSPLTSSLTMYLAIDHCTIDFHCVCHRNSLSKRVRDGSLPHYSPHCTLRA